MLNILKSFVLALPLATCLGHFIPVDLTGIVLDRNSLLDDGSSVSFETQTSAEEPQPGQACMTRDVWMITLQTISSSRQVESKPERYMVTFLGPKNSKGFYPVAISGVHVNPYPEYRIIQLYRAEYEMHRVTFGVVPESKVCRGRYFEKLPHEAAITLRNDFFRACDLELALMSSDVTKVTECLGEAAKREPEPGEVRKISQMHVAIKGALCIKVHREFPCDAVLLGSKNPDGYYRIGILGDPAVLDLKYETITTKTGNSGLISFGIAHESHLGPDVEYLFVPATAIQVGEELYQSYISSFPNPPWSHMKAKKHTEGEGNPDKTEKGCIIS